SGRRHPVSTAGQRAARVPAVSGGPHLRRDEALLRGSERAAGTPREPDVSTHLSKRLFEEARRVIPGGVNSPVRAWKAVGGEPLFVQRAHGCWVVDADGREYIDYVGSWGPMILGHA